METIKYERENLVEILNPSSVQETSLAAKFLVCKIFAKHFCTSGSHNLQKFCDEK